MKFLVLCIAAMGCASTPPAPSARGLPERVVKERAHADLQCPTEELSVAGVTRWATVRVPHVAQRRTFGVTGCGRDGTYVVDCFVPDLEEMQCIVVPAVGAALGAALGATDGAADGAAGGAAGGAAP